MVRLVEVSEERRFGEVKAKFRWVSQGKISIP